MDFTLTETEEALRDLTARIVGDQTEPARSKAAEADARAGGPGVDAALWSALTGAGLLAAFLDPTDPAPTPNRGREGRMRGVAARGSADVGGGEPGVANRGREGRMRGVAARGSADVGDGESGVSNRAQEDRMRGVAARASADVGDGDPGEPGEPGGTGGDGRPGVVAAALMCREAGATVAPVPLLSSLAALLAARDCEAARVVGACAAIAAGDGWAAVAVSELGGAGPRWAPVTATSASEGVVVLDGVVGLVPDLPGAAWVVVEAVDANGAAGAYWVDTSASGVAIQHVVTTAARAAGHLTLTGASAIGLGGPPAGLTLQALMCAAQAGVCSSAIAAAASYLGTRHQFGRPLSSFQAPVHRLVDAYIDTDAIWLTTLLAAWRLDQGIDATAAVDVARWWAADAGNRAVHTVQHLHGGIGADVDYPVHRYFLWAKTLGDSLGGSAAHLAHLGSLIATGADL